MAVLANPRLVAELEHYGAQDVVKCYHCGNCTAACPFSRGAVHLPAQVDALPADGAGGQAARQPRAVALLLLRRVLRAVPARGRARRDHDEHAPLADRAVRLHRHLQALLPLLEGRAGRHPARGPAHRRWASSPTGSSGGGGILRSTTGHGAFLPARACTSSTGCMAGGAPRRCSWSTASRMWWFTMGATAASASRSAPTCASLVLLPLHFFTQKRYRECERQAALAHPPRAHAELRDHARPHHVLPARHAGRPGDPAGRCTSSATWPRSASLGTAIYAIRGRIRKTRAALPALARDRLDLPRHALLRGR